MQSGGCRLPTHVYVWYSTLEFTVYFCYHIAYGGTWVFYIDKIIGDVDCVVANVDDPYFWKGIDSTIFVYVKDHFNFPPCGQGQKQVVEIERRLCWKLHNIVHPNWTMAIEYCDYQTLTCVTLYEICYDYFTQQVIANKIYTLATGDGDCEDIVPEMPPPGKTWEEEWYTDCFRTFCDYLP